MERDANHAEPAIHPVCFTRPPQKLKAAVDRPLRQRLLSIVFARIDPEPVIPPLGEPKSFPPRGFVRRVN